MSAAEGRLCSPSRASPPSPPHFSSRPASVSDLLTTRNHPPSSTPTPATLSLSLDAQQEGILARRHLLSCSFPATFNQSRWTFVSLILTEADRRGGDGAVLKRKDASLTSKYAPPLSSATLPALAVFTWRALSTPTVSVARDAARSSRRMS